MLLGLRRRAGGGACPIRRNWAIDRPVTQARRPGASECRVAGTTGRPSQLSLIEPSDARSRGACRSVPTAEGELKRQSRMMQPGSAANPGSGRDRV